MDALARSESSALPSARWSVRLLGAVEARGVGGTITRWPSRAVAALLARLALEPDCAHPREELIELLWPGVSLEVGRNRLRQALSTLRTLLEPPGPHPMPVLVADRQAVRVVPGALACDVRELERRIGRRQGSSAADDAPSDFMPGFYDAWIVDERARLAAWFERAQRPPHGLAPVVDETPAPLAPSGPARPVLSLAMPGPAAAVAPAMPTLSNAVAQAAAATLPNYLTRAFGLERAAQALCRLVLQVRLVTVHGPGGSGKTRLAVEAAGALARSGVPSTGSTGGDTESARLGRADRQHARLEAFDSVLFVSLVPCETAVDLLQALAAALGATGSGPVRQRVCAALDGRRALVVLDNAEQLLPQADREIAALLTELPTLHVLVTSRRRLGVDGETAFDLDGLDLPQPAGKTTTGSPAAALAANPAVALFTDRARAARADFHLGARNAEAVAELVRLLGGMPLAIELAASRVRSMPPQELLRRLRESAGTPTLDLLERQRSRASPDARHASMRHMVAWSWRHLAAEQSSLMRSLAALRAPADEALIADVADLSPAAAGELLGGLRDLSLLAPAPGDESTVRHALLQPVREFAAEQAGAEWLCLARGRLRSSLLARARSAGAGEMARMAALLPHVHEAIVSAPADGDGRCALELAVALGRFWESEGIALPVLVALEECLAAAGGDAALLGDVLPIVSFGRWLVGSAEIGLAHIERALELTLDDGRRSGVLVRWAAARYYRGDMGADLFDVAAEATALAERHGDAVNLAIAYRMQAMLECNLRVDHAGAERLLARSQKLWEQVGDYRMAMRRLQERALMWSWLRRSDEACAVLRECADAAWRDADWLHATTCRRQLGRVLVRRREWEAAAAAFRSGLELAWERQNVVETAECLLHLPGALVHQPAQLELAARLQGFAWAHWTRLFGRINRIEEREVRCTRRLLRLRLGAARAEALRVSGLRWSVAQAVAAALRGEAAP